MLSTRLDKFSFGVPRAGLIVHVHGSGGFLQALNETIAPFSRGKDVLATKEKTYVNSPYIRTYSK